MKAPPFSSLYAEYAYPIRTLIAAVAALVAARLLALPESYWAAISALIVVQPDFRASLKVSWHRLIGTAIGAGIGAFFGTFLGRGVPLYALGLFLVGFLSTSLRLGQPANRFAAIAFSIVVLVVRAEPAWQIAVHRFIEVSIGILSGLCLSALLPEPRPDRAG
jgi:uncharacterized membrane protein YgaE (UPF0421/DUF939 family)